MVAIGAASNACGTINPITEVAKYTTFSRMKIFSSDLIKINNLLDLTASFDFSQNKG